MMCGGESTELDEVREQAVRAELAHLLESASFRTSKRSREFLQYIVEHTMHGPSGSLKERSIGVELFQLPQDFDPGQHTIVRVTANEVRKRLAQHYVSENGNPHAVRIDLSAGSYKAGFRWETPDSEDAVVADEAVPLLPVAELARPTPQLPPPQIRARHNMVPWAVAFLALAGGLLWSKWGGGKEASAESISGAVPGAAPVTAPVGDDLRIVMGAGSPFVDRRGRTWGPDRFFSGGSVSVHPSERIVRTLDPDLYRHLRSGDFRYAIPLTPGSYELHL